MGKIQRYSDGCFQQPDVPAMSSGINPDSEFVAMEVTGAESLLGFDPREALDEYNDDYED